MEFRSLASPLGRGSSTAGTCARCVAGAWGLLVMRHNHRHEACCDAGWGRRARPDGRELSGGFGRRAGEVGTVGTGIRGAAMAEGGGFAEEMDNPAIRNMTRRLLGLRTWGVKQSLGSSLILDMGAAVPDPRLRSGVRGEWSLLVLHCDWVVATGCEFLAASEDGRSRIASALAHIEGTTVTSVVILPPAFDTTFAFSGGVVLRLFPYQTREYDHWKLFLPEGMVFTAGPGSRWRLRSKHAPDAET